MLLSSKECPLSRVFQKGMTSRSGYCPFLLFLLCLFVVLMKSNHTSQVLPWCVSSASPCLLSSWAWWCRALITPSLCSRGWQSKRYWNISRLLRAFVFASASLQNVSSRIRYLVCYEVLSCSFILSELHIVNKSGSKDCNDLKLSSLRVIATEGAFCRGKPFVMKVVMKWLWWTWHQCKRHQYRQSKLFKNLS